MGVSPEMIRNFNMEFPIFNIQEMKDQSNIYSFNPIEKTLEQAAKIEDLYKDLLKVEGGRVEELTNTNKALQSLIEGMKK
jgi:hypothetical protein